MMAKIFSSILFTIVCLLMIPSQAQAWSLAGYDWNCSISSYTFKFRAAYFQPESKKITDIYGDSWADYEIEISRPIDFLFENWKVWGGINWLGDKGRSIGYSDRTTIHVVPINLGLTYHFCVYHTKCYAGAGVCYSHLVLENCFGSYGKEHITKNQIGGVLKAGVEYYLNATSFIEAFIDYFHQRFNLSNESSSYGYSSYGFFNDRIINLSGWKIGGGFGLSF